MKTNGVDVAANTFHLPGPSASLSKTLTPDRELCYCSATPIDMTKRNSKCRSAGFYLGFFLCAGIFLIVNGLEIYRQTIRICFDCDKGFGFPFRFYESGTVFHDYGILWLGLTADVLVVLASSVFLGLMVETIVKGLGRTRFS